jgi:hypothetical protein
MIPKLSNLMICSSLAVTGKVPWFRSQEINSPIKRKVSSTLTPKEAESKLRN